MLSDLIYASAPNPATHVYYMYMYAVSCSWIIQEACGGGGGGGSSSNKKNPSDYIDNHKYHKIPHVQLRIRYICIAFSRFAKRVFIYSGAFENAIIIPRFHSTRNMLHTEPLYMQRDIQNKSCYTHAIYVERSMLQSWILSRYIRDCPTLLNSLCWI